MAGKRSQNRKAVGSPLSDNVSDNSSKEQEYFLPIANVSRIMKKSLPANAKISKEAKETVQECVSEFISFITGEASEKCQMEKRKTINGDDLLWAMSTLGFENYVEPLRDYLSKYRETEGEKNSMAMKEDHSAATSSSNNTSLGEINQVTSFISSRPDLQNPNNGDHHLIGARMAAKGKGLHENVIGYDDNIMTDHGFSIGKIHEIEENAYMAMASNLHQW